MVDRGDLLAPQGGEELELIVPFRDGLALRAADGTPAEEARGAGGYPTARLTKGLVLLDRGEDLAEEGVGFGVPVLKRGAQAIFAGHVGVAWWRAAGAVEVELSFTMNLSERFAGADGTSRRRPNLEAARDALAAVHRGVPHLRTPLTRISNEVRRRFGWHTTFAEGEMLGTVRVNATIADDGGRISVVVDPSGVAGSGATELIVMNELGARRFDCYRDDGLRLAGAAIGTWDEVAAPHAAFVSAAHGVSFALPRVAGARLFRGRELVGARLAWAGFGYAQPAPFAPFEYALEIARERP